MNYVYSTLTCDNEFAVYAPKNDPRALSVIKKRILIKGGHGVKNHLGIDTPKGVVTQVSDEDLDILEKHYSFQKQVKAGFIVVDRKERAPATVAVDMAQKDASAPLTPADFEKGDNDSPEAPVYKKKGKKE